MTSTRRSRVIGLAAVVTTVAVVVGVAAGCTTTPSTSPTPQSSAPGPASPSEAATQTPAVENSYTPPAKTPGVPDASTAGRLTAKSLPNPVLGFKGEIVDPDEGEYNPNGTWVHALDATQAAFESLPQCTAVRLADLPRPQAALSGTYRDGRGDPGNALGLQFVDETTATAFFALYADQLRACAAAGSASQVVVTDLAVTDTTITGRRAYSPQEKWSEMIKRSGVVVVMVILADGHRTTPAKLATTAATF